MKLDHVELFVPSRQEAAEWYGRVLAFEAVAELAHWAAEGGPLMISNDDGATLLALFRGKPQGDAEVRGLRRLAFRVDAAGFADFVASSGTWRTPPLTAGDVQDHGKAVSVYFSDPWGNLLEVTTYEPEAARRAVGG